MLLNWAPPFLSLVGTTAYLHQLSMARVRIEDAEFEDWLQLDIEDNNWVA